MKTVWIASLAIAVATSAAAETTIYKLVDESGRVTYSNKPMKGSVVLELDPLTTIPASPVPARGATRAEARPAALTVTQPSLASVDPQVQKKRDDERRSILESELAQEQQALDAARKSLAQEQQNPALIAAVRVAQQATDPTAAQMAEYRTSIDKASGRIRGLQATVAEHEKNVEAIRKELGSLKP